MTFAAEGLDLDQDRPVAVEGGDDDRARHPRASAGEEESARVGHPDQALLGHLQHAEVVGGAVAVFDRPQQAQGVVLVPLEGQDRVDDVLQGLGPGQAAVLGHLADQDDRTAPGPGLDDHPLGHGPHLVERAGGRAGLGVEGGLHRVDHHEVGADLVEGADKVVERGVGVQPQAVGHDPQALGPGPHLDPGLLRGGVEGRAARSGHRRGHLEKQGGLAHSRRAPDHGDRAGHETAAEHPVDLLDAGRDGTALFGGHVPHQESRLTGRHHDGAPDGPDGLLDQGVPLAARGALPGPLRRGRPAGRTAVDGPGSAHGRTLRTGGDRLTGGSIERLFAIDGGPGDLAEPLPLGNEPLVDPSLPFLSMRPRKPIALVLLCTLLAGGCSLLEDDAAASDACGQALTRSAQVTDARALALARTEAVTEMDPEGTAAVIAHRDEAQRAIFGPVARLVTRADRRAAQYRRLRSECRQATGDLSPDCEEAFTLSTRLAGRYAEATRTRVDYWSEQVAMAQSAWEGRAAATRQAIDRWDRLLTDYERQMARIDRTAGRRMQAAGDCRDTL